MNTMKDWPFALKEVEAMAEVMDTVKDMVKDVVAMDMVEVKVVAAMVAETHNKL